MAGETGLEVVRLAMSGRECVKIDPAILQTPSPLATTKAVLTFKDQISCVSSLWGCAHSQVLVFHLIESFGACQRHGILDMHGKPSAAFGQGSRHARKLREIRLPLFHEGVFALFALFAHIIKQRGVPGEIEEAHLAVAVGVERGFEAAQG